MTDFSHIIRVARQEPVSDGRRLLAFRKLLAKRAPETAKPPIESLSHRLRKRSPALRLRRFLEIERRGG